MMDNFFSSSAVLDIRRACDIRLVLEYWRMHLCMHHACNEQSLCIRFDSIWSSLIYLYSTFMIDPVELAELIFDSSPGHTCFEVAQICTRLSLGARPLTTIPSCMIRVVPLCQMSMSRRYPTEPRSPRDFACALSCACKPARIRPPFSLEICLL